MQPNSTSPASQPGISPSLFSLQLPNDSRSVRLAGGTVMAALHELGFAPADAAKMQQAVAEACVNVLKHAYRPDEIATFDVQAGIEFGKLKVRVKDNGLPYDPFHTPRYDPAHPETRDTGLFRMEHLAHEVRYINLGREGKAFDLLYTLPGGWAHHPHELHSDADDPTPPDPKSLRVRVFQPDDAAPVARCAYRVYGYSYFGEHLYIPERLIALNRQGDLISVVVADDAGRVFGHLALIFSPERVIPEAGQAFVMPTVRGGGCLKKMKSLLYDIATQRGLPGVFSDAVTVHPFTQKANLSFNSRPCGMLLAFAPGSVQYKQISEPDKQRHTLVVFYKPLHKQPKTPAYLPTRHAAMIRDIYDNLGLDRELMPATLPDLVSNTIFDVVSNSLRDIAYLTVRQFGADFVEQLRHKLRQLCAHGMAVIQLDLPMSDPGAAHFTEAIESLGFFFCGAIPRYFGDSDSLRFEYLNNVEVDTTSLVLEGEFTKRLFDYIVALSKAASR